MRVFAGPQLVIPRKGRGFSRCSTRAILLPSGFEHRVQAQAVGFTAARCSKSCARRVMSQEILSKCVEGYSPQPEPQTLKPDSIPLTSTVGAVLDRLFATVDGLGVAATMQPVRALGRVDLHVWQQGQGRGVKQSYPGPVGNQFTCGMLKVEGLRETVLPEWSEPVC